MTSEQDTKLGEKEVLLIVSGVPAVAYWLAYIYEYGYCKYFEIPIEFIDVSLKNILVCAFAIVVFYFYTSNISELFWSFTKNIPHIIKTKLKRTVYPAAWGIAIAIVFKVHLKFIFIYLALFVSSVFIYEFILPLITHRKLATYTEKLEKAQSDDFAYDSYTDVFASRIGILNFRILFKLMGLTILVMFLGSLGGALKTNFMVSSAEDKIVLKIHESNFLAAEYDKYNNSYKLSFTLLNNEQLGQFNYKKVGKLTLVDEKK